MALVIQSFGRENEYRRAAFTVLSYYAHAHSDNPMRTILFTDNPGYFDAYLQGLPVEFVLLTEEKIRVMRGAIDFLHRMKIAIIEEAFARTGESLLYADSDTFFTTDPTPLFQQLAPNVAFMHTHEYRFDSMRGMGSPGTEVFLDLIEQSIFILSDGSSLRIGLEQSSWNAGVMFLHHSHVRFLADVYALTDQFYPSTRNHASEQYAFSVILQNRTTLSGCDEVIFHYWYRIKKQIADIFFQKFFANAWFGMPLVARLASVERAAGMLPSYFDRHILTVRDTAIQAFNENRFNEGIRTGAKAFLRRPLYFPFLRDYLYHLKRFLLHTR